MIWALLAAAAAIAGLCWWGAGVILCPPDKAQLVVFPEHYGLDYERVSFKTKDGLTLKGWFIPSPTRDERTLLMCHGWGENKGHLLERSYFLNKTAGFNLLYFDNRSHGESEGLVTTIGYLEKIDCQAALDYLKATRPTLARRVGIFGLSMGAAVAILTMAEDPELRAAVLESPFPEYSRVVRRWSWDRFRLPYFPLVIVTLWMLKLRVGIPEVSLASPLRFVKRIAPRPLFFIGGTDDVLMTEGDVRELYRAAGDPKQLWIVPGGIHGDCRAASEREYDQRVIEFYNKHL